MEAVIFAFEDRDGFGRFQDTKGSTGKTEKYIRADLVDRLKGYAVHKPMCGGQFGDGYTCTCGLTEVLKEME